MAARTLVLNSAFQPILIIPWQDAMRMVLLDKAIVQAVYEEKVRSQKVAWDKPAVIMVKKYIDPSIIRGRKFSRRSVYMRDGYRCQYCGAEPPTAELTLDHVVPKSKGGPRTWENIVTSCTPCNQKKGDRSLKSSGLNLMVRPRRPVWPSRQGAEPEWIPYLPPGATCKAT